MKEKYIFFTLLVIALVILIGTAIGRRAKNEISPEELAIEKKLKHVAQRKLTLPTKIDIDEVQNLVAFSYYEGLLKRSPFFRVRPKRAKASETKIEVSSLEEMTPVFVYKGRITAGNCLVVIIEQPRSGEVVMVSRGENIDGYKVLDITDTEVILSKKGEENIILNTIESPGL